MTNVRHSILIPAFRRRSLLAAIPVAVALVAGVVVPAASATLPAAAPGASGAGMITTFAGGGVSDGGPATSAVLGIRQARPQGVAVEPSGNVYFTAASFTFNLTGSSPGFDRVRRIDAATGVITTVAGRGSSGFSGDGGPATSAQLSNRPTLCSTAPGTCTSSISAISGSASAPTIYREVWSFSMNEPRLSAAQLARRLEQYRADYDAAKSTIAEVGFICEGSVAEFYTCCRKPNCKCVDPNRRHGPYYQLTWKQAGKTVSRRQTADEARLYKEWIANRRQLDSVVRQMQDVSRGAGEYLLAETGRPFHGPERRPQRRRPRPSTSA